MRPKRDPLPRVRDAWVWLGGILMLGVLGAGVTAAARLLWENIDIRQLAPQLAAAPAPLPEAEPAVPPAVDSTRFEAVFFDAPRNRDYFPDSTFYPRELRRWSDLVTEVGGVVSTVSGAEGLRTLEPHQLLVLPEALCMSPAERAAILDHVAESGSVVANWAVGARDADCEWRGFHMLQDLTGAEDVREIASRDALFLTVPGGIASSPGFDPGTRLELRPDPSLALRMQGPRVYWSDWALNPAPDESGGGADVAVATIRTPEGGRAAWFGMRPDQAATRGDSVHLHQLLRNGILWASGVATAAPAAWPGGKRTALVFTLDVEAEPRNALDMAALLEAEGLPGSFYAVSQLVEDDAELGAALAAVGEVGSQTSDHNPVAGLTAQGQTVRLRRAWDEIERWTGVAPKGLRPPEEAFDAVTVRAWQRAGGTYILAGNEARSASPELHRTVAGPVVLLPRLVKDDYNVIVLDQALRAGRLTEAFLHGARKMRAIGGLAVVAGHTQIMNSGRRLQAIRTVADSARADGDVWIATAADVAEWWRARSEVRVRFLQPDPPPGTRADVVSDLVVEAPPDRGVSDLWIDLVSPLIDDEVTPIVQGESAAFVRTDWGLRLPVGTLGAGESRRVSLVIVDPPDAPGGG